MVGTVAHTYKCTNRKISGVKKNLKMENIKVRFCFSRVYVVASTDKQSLLELGKEARALTWQVPA